MVVFLGIISFPAFSQAEKPVISVLDLELSNVAESDAQVITDYLSTYLVNSGKYRVIDRSQRDILLSELAFSLSGCTDVSCQIEVGKMLAADEIMVGSIGNIGERFLLTLKIISVESGETTKNISEKYLDINSLIDNCSGLVLRLIDSESDKGDAAQAMQTETGSEDIGNTDPEDPLVMTNLLIKDKAYRKKAQISVFQDYSAMLPYSERYRLFKENELKSPIVFSALNTLCGTGSWLQGDIKGGLLVSGLMVGGTLAILIPRSLHDGQDDTDSPLFIGGACSVVSGLIIGWIIPYVFGPKNNRNLKDALLIQ